MPFISKLKLKNFKRFGNLSIVFNDSINIIVGDNATGKSSILEAIDLCLSANRNYAEDENLKFIINTECIHDFCQLPVEQRTFDRLPILEIEVFIEGLSSPDFDGANNSEGNHVSGLRLRIAPDPELGQYINQIVCKENFSFPYEFYKASFNSFQGGGFTKYSCPIGHLLIDHAAIGATTATNDYIRKMFTASIQANQLNELSHGLRSSKAKYNKESLDSLTDKGPEKFVLRTDKYHTIAHSISLESDGVDIIHQGKGNQSLVKIKFALEKRSERTNVLLIEEPENHLSHSSMMNLLRIFKETHSGQTIISTHNSLIASGLRLNNLLILGNSTTVKFVLSDLDKTTSEFFAKAPDHLLLEFILSKKVLLVEGSAEYILFPVFYERYFKGRIMENDGIHLISVGGIKFKRYLKISKFLEKRTAFIQDNDGKEKDIILKQYLDSEDDETSIIDDNIHHLGLSEDIEYRTFEQIIYKLNEKLCHKLFEKRVKKNTVLEYMLANKTKVALDLAKHLQNNPTEEFIIPDYIKNAFVWLHS